MSDRKQSAHGQMHVQFMGRVATDPRTSNIPSSDGTTFEQVYVTAVCSPWNGQKEPESIWVNVAFSGSTVALAKKLAKGDEFLVTGNVIKAPAIFDRKDKTQGVNLEIRASREPGSLQIFKKDWLKNGTGSAEKTEEPVFSDQDVPF
jgi:hypothetical protein